MIDKTVAQIAQYSAPYMGNFINSLIELESQMKVVNNAIVYVFPENCKNTNWINKFKANRKVYFISDSACGKFFISKQVVEQIKEICIKENINIIHTHFDGYDIPALMASKVNEKIQVVWHSHNAREYLKDVAKKIYQKIMFYRHYKVYGKGAWLISVSDYYLTKVSEFGFPANRSVFIPNGIDLERIDYKRNIDCSKISGNIFLAFGGRGYDKGVDLLLDAIEVLSQQDINFSLILVKGTDTLTFVQKKFGENIPHYLNIVEPEEDINKLFLKADYFVSSSRRECLSYANLEALAFGLPIICSTACGNLWFEKFDSVLMFETENYNDLSKKMNELMNEDRNDLTSRCIRNRKNILHNYTAKIWAREVINFYNRII